MLSELIENFSEDCCEGLHEYSAKMRFFRNQLNILRYFQTPPISFDVNFSKSCYSIREKRPCANRAPLRQAVLRTVANVQLNHEKEITVARQSKTVISFCLFPLYRQSLIQYQIETPQAGVSRLLPGAFFYLQLLLRLAAGSLHLGAGILLRRLSKYRFLPAKSLAG